MNLNRRGFIGGVLASGLAGCSSFSGSEKCSATRKILINGKIYTEDVRKPWAQAVAIDGKNFAAVGTNEEIARFAKFNFGGKYEVVDLGGKTVLPGLIDGHTHPSFVSGVSWVIMGSRTEDKEELYENIRQAAKDHPKEVCPYFVYNAYVAKTFGGEGPSMADLDKLIPDRPARINDDSGHGCTYNTMALEMLKDENGVPHSAEKVGGQTFFKDKNGKYTGRAFQTPWTGDIGVFEAIGWYPPTGMNDESITPFLNCLRHFGDIGIMEAAVFSEDDVAYVSKLDREDRLHLYYDCTVMLYDMKGIEETIATARKWQERYESDHIRIRTVKFFGDGSSEAGDVLSLIPFANDPTGKNYGKCNFTFEEMRDVLVRLNKERLDLHVHMICDGTLRRMLDAVEAAQKICGDDWCIRVTLAHLECMHPDDAKRFKKLGVYADITAHWLGDVPMATRMHLGDERADHLFDYSQFRKDKVSYGFSTDTMVLAVDRMPLFLGFQIAMTGIEPGGLVFTATDLKKYPNGRLPEGAKFTLEECIHAATWTNAERMRILDKVGSIEVGKRACLTVLDKDIFTIPTKEISSIDPVCTYFDGQELHIPCPAKE